MEDVPDETADAAAGRTVPSDVVLRDLMARSSSGHRDRAGDPITLQRWAELYEDLAYRVVAEHRAGDVVVRTVWQGVVSPVAEGLFFVGVSRDGGVSFKDDAWADTEAEVLVLHRAVCIREAFSSVVDGLGPERIVDHGGERWRIKTVNGWHVEVVPMMVNWRVHTVAADGGPLAWSDRYWCYAGRGVRSFVAACLAAYAWDVADDTEPVGWVRSWDHRRNGEGPVAPRRTDGW